MKVFCFFFIFTLPALVTCQARTTRIQVSQEKQREAKHASDGNAMSWQLRHEPWSTCQANSTCLQLKCALLYQLHSKTCRFKWEIALFKLQHKALGANNNVLIEMCKPSLLGFHENKNKQCSVKRFRQFLICKTNCSTQYAQTFFIIKIPDIHLQTNLQSNCMPCITFACLSLFLRCMWF